MLAHFSQSKCEFVRICWFHFQSKFIQKNSFNCFSPSHDVCTYATRVWALSSPRVNRNYLQCDDDVNSVFMGLPASKITRKHRLQLRIQFFVMKIIQKICFFLFFRCWAKFWLWEIWAGQIWYVWWSHLVCQNVWAVWCDLEFKDSTWTCAKKKISNEVTRIYEVERFYSTEVGSICFRPS